MELAVKFAEIDIDIGVEFDESIQIESGGNYEEGWNDGFADGVNQGYGDGYEDGYQEGYAEGENDGLIGGYENGYESGYEDGKASVNVADVLKYAKVVESLFAEATFPDGYELTADISSVTSNIGSMFRKSMGIKKLTIAVDPEVLPTRAYNASYFYYGTSAIKPDVEEIVLPDGIKFTDFSRFVGYCESLKSISGRIDLSECTTVLYCFMNCYALQEVRFMPGTISLSIEFGQSSKLSVDSLASIVEGLATVTTTQTLKFHATAKSKLTEAQKAIITQKGWTLA